MIGKTLGHYQIAEKLGAGGMGEVYRAEDTNLHRRVAIKVLPDEFAHDAERVARFQREAQVLASLNHPNIATLHGLEVSDGKHFIVMELVEGQTLAHRLLRGPLPVDDALEVCRQIAEGLEAAHEKGVIHRDLKPGNVMITADDRVKILDFGLAKSMAADPRPPDGTHSPTITEAMTHPGIILGTAAYMSPEQARGKPVDKRADIWAFGCILFECLTGKKTYGGETITETLAVILKGEPEWELLPAATPWKVKSLLRQCLRKDPSRRFQHIGDVRILLADVKEELDSGSPILEESAKASRGGARRHLVWAAVAGFMLMTLGLTAGHFFWPRPDQEQPRFQRLTFSRGTIQTARFSPDGNTVFYGASWEGDPARAYSIRLDSPEYHPTVASNAIPLSVSGSGELMLLLKPQRLGWETVGTLAKLPLSGGTPRQELENVQWADWGPHGEMLIVRDGEKGNQLESPPGKVLFTTAGLVSDARFSPAGDRIAFLHHPLRDADLGEVMVVDLAGQSRLLSSNWGSSGGLAWNPRTGEIWFTATRNLARRELQAVTLEGTWRTVDSQTGNLIVEDIARDGRVLLNTTSFQRKLQFVGPGGKNARELSWMDWSWVSDISSDGRAIVLNESGEGSRQVWGCYYRATDGSPPVMLGNGACARLSPDEKAVVAIDRASDGLVFLPIGTGQTRRIPLPGLRLVLVAWLPNGRGVLFTGSEGGHGERVYSLNLDDTRPKAITPEGVFPICLLVSPSGRFAAALDLQKHVLLYPVVGGDPTVCRGVAPGEVPWGWSQDEKSLYVMEQFTRPARVYEVDWKSGERKLWKEIAFPDPAGVMGTENLVLNAGGQCYAFSYRQDLSTLHIVDGLK